MNNLKSMKNLVLMSIGAGAVLAYQKYKAPIMNKINTMMEKM